MAAVPERLLHLLRDPNYGHLATVRPDGTPQVNPMWFLFDEATKTLRFTHTSTRAKFRNLQANPGMAGAEGAAEHPPLPRTWLEAIETFEASTAMQRIFGEPLHQGFAAIKRAEHDQLAVEVSEAEWRLYGFVV